MIMITNFDFFIGRVSDWKYARSRPPNIVNSYNLGRCQLFEIVPSDAYFLGLIHHVVLFRFVYHVFYGLIKYTIRFPNLISFIIVSVANQTFHPRINISVLVSVF